MVNENALRDVLVTLAEISRDQYRLLVDLASEIAALEKAVSALDPTFADSFVIRRQQAAQKLLHHRNLRLRDTIT
jgi:hypothetical protein